MRVGALPQFPSNFLKYNLTWSTVGLINEYCNPCEAIHDGVRRDVLPLEGLEHFSLDGVRYEAFNTSGGLGSLCETFDGRVRELNYKTIRYLGHRDYMAFLLHELRMSQSRDVLKGILEAAIPVTFQDVVVVFCTVSGWRNGQLVQVSDARKIYNSTIGGQNWSAIQITTAAGVCVMLDLHRTRALGATGVVRQEQVSLEAFLTNRFGQPYQAGASSLFNRSMSVFSGELQ
jgi:saccharopine dehydrogenase-like NADP-dependent oxidoreductase